MIVKNEQVVFFDVDRTLVIAPDASAVGQRLVNVYDAATDSTITLRVHEPMLRLLQEERFRGSFVVVWSRGGYRWADAVIQALGVDDCVDQIMTKPTVYFDDMDASEWMINRVYLDPNDPYKK